MTTKVFISYAHKDAALVNKFERELVKIFSDESGRKMQQFGLWFDPGKGVPAGQNWRDSIKAQIKDSDKVLVVITDTYAAANSWMGYEVGAAEALNKPILTLASDRIPISDLPEDLISGQIVQFDSDAPERAAREVAERLAAA